MDLPERFVANITRIFKDNGRQWLAGLDHRFDLCIKKWDLKSCVLASDLSINLICFAESEDFGSVVLKMGVPHAELFTEIEALSLYQGRGICRCYDFDLELGALLLERIVPGTDLINLKDQERFRVAAGLISQLPLPVTASHGLPTYTDWLARAFSRARNDNAVGERMLFLVDQAERMFNQLRSRAGPSVLLHGDLHHKNILQDSHGQWKAIDPKGATGMQCLEAGRFMINQFGMVDRDNRFRSVQDMAGVFGRALGERSQSVAACGFIDAVLSNCWSVEDNPERDRLHEAVEFCSSFLDCVRQLDSRSGRDRGG